MKYLKKFENYIKEGKYFWLIQTDEFYKIKLHKIGCPEDIIINYFTPEFERFLIGIKRDKDYLQVGHNENPEPDKLEWSYDYSSSVTYHELGYKYMGEVELTSEDMEEYKWNKMQVNTTYKNNIKL